MTAFDYVETPTGADLLSYLGWPTDAEILAQAEQHVAQVVLACRSYTRHQGWFSDGRFCREDIAVVIISAAARSLSSPDQARRVEAGSYSALPSPFVGWTLVEQHVLHNYRRTTA